MSELIYELRVPKDRVAVLIGKKGEVKQNIEASTKTKLDIDSQEGVVTITGDDGLGLFDAKEIIKAIGRGFNPEIAMLLLKADYSLELIDISDFAGKSKNDMIRLKGRIIGERGKSRKIIEDLTETSISVYGKTIGILGDSTNVAAARRAVESLLGGAQHATIYKQLEKFKKDASRAKFLGVETFKY